MQERADILPIPGFSEPFSSLTHLGGALIFAILGYFLVLRGRGNGWRVAALAVFAFSCVALLSISGVYHLLAHDTTARNVMMRVDHAAIFILIAGSFTPVHVILLRKQWHDGLLAGIWSAAITQLIMTTVYFSTLPAWLGLSMYLGLGWLGTISTVALARRYGVRFVLPLLWGALAYTLGALVDYFDWLAPLAGVVGPHEVFHLAVLAGIGFHWAFIRSIAAGEITTAKNTSGAGRPRSRGAWTTS